MNKLFPMTTKDFLSCYLDDVLIFSQSIEEHLHHLSLVLNTFSEANVSVNFKKSKFLLFEIPFLGHIVSGGEIKVDSRLNKPIRDFPLPRTKRQLRRFLGLAGWRRKYIKNFSCLVESLVALLRKDAKFMFGPAELESFKGVKEALVSPPALIQPDLNKDFHIFSDACEISLAGYLSQIGYDEEYGVISYAS